MLQFLVDDIRKRSLLLWHHEVIVLEVLHVRRHTVMIVLHHRGIGPSEHILSPSIFRRRQDRLVVAIVAACLFEAIWRANAVWHVVAMRLTVRFAMRLAARGRLVTLDVPIADGETLWLRAVDMAVIHVAALIDLTILVALLEVIEVAEL